MKKTKHRFQESGHSKNKTYRKKGHTMNSPSLHSGEHLIASRSSNIRRFSNHSYHPDNLSVVRSDKLKHGFGSVSTKTLNTSKIVKKFMEMLNCIKIFHWQTRSFAKHKASDELYEELNENIDKFVETLLGKSRGRIKHLERRFVLYNECPTGNDSIKNRIFEFCEFLEDMNMYFDKDKDSDLLNVRDEILGNLHKFLYLLTFH